MTDYIRIDVCALESDGLAEAWKRAATLDSTAKAEQQAYRDQVVANLVALHPERGGQAKVAKLLETSQRTVSEALKRHRSRTMPRTITTLTPQGAREVSRTWEQVIHRDAAGDTRTWMTRAGQTRRITLVPVREGAKTRWALKWTPGEAADADLTRQAMTAIEPLYRSTDLEASLRDATLWLHENPMGPQPAEPAPRPDTQTHTVNITRTSGEDVTVTWQRRIYPKNLGGGTGPWRAVLNGEAATVYEGGGPSRTGLPTWNVSVGETKDTVTAATGQDALKEATYRHGLPESPTT